MFELCVPRGQALFSEELALEFVHVLFGLVDVLIVCDSLQVLLKILLFDGCALAVVSLTLCVQTLHHHLLLLLVLVLVLLPAGCSFQIPHLGIVVLNASILLLVSRTFLLNLGVPVLALVLLDKVFAFDSHLHLITVIFLALLELVLALQHLVLALFKILRTNLLA